MKLEGMQRRFTRIGVFQLRGKAGEAECYVLGEEEAKRGISVVYKGLTAGNLSHYYR